MSTEPAEEPTTSRESSQQYGMEEGASGDDYHSDADNVQANQSQRVKTKRVHEIMSSDESDSCDDRKNKSNVKKKTPARKKRVEESDDSAAFRGMAESVSGIAAMLKKKQDDKPFTQLGVVEMWAICLGQKIVKLSEKRARRLMYQMDGMVIEACDEEELENAGKIGGFGGGFD